MCIKADEDNPDAVNLTPVFVQGHEEFNYHFDNYKNDLKSFVDQLNKLEGVSDVMNDLLEKASVHHKDRFLPEQSSLYCKMIQVHADTERLYYRELGEDYDMHRYLTGVTGSVRWWC